MSINYASLQATATQLITGFGTPYTLTRPSINGDIALAKGVYGTFDKQVNSLFPSTGGGPISSDTKQIYITVVKNGKVEPAPEDRLIQGAQNWRVKSVEVIRPDGVTTIYYALDVT